jgi:hypothetical protein
MEHGIALSKGTSSGDALHCNTAKATTSDVDLRQRESFRRNALINELPN